MKPSFKRVATLKYTTDFGSFQPGPYTTKLIEALEENRPKRRTKAYKTLFVAVEGVIRQEMQTRARLAWEAGLDVGGLETP